VKQYNKQYETDQVSHRYQIFKSNVDFVLNHNADPEATYKVAINQFGDLTADEYIRTSGGLFVSPHPVVESNNEQILAELEKVKEASALDWRDSGVITPVINQGSCGSCWTWSVGGAVEAAWAIQYGDLKRVSAQQLLDCAGSYGNHGCAGGFMDWTFKYLVNSDGICTDSDYPYEGRQGRCRKSNCKPFARIASYGVVQPKNEKQLLKAVNQVPVSVAVMASTRGFQFYKSGVINKNCSRGSLNHAVLLVGYGEDNGMPYWQVKNSWGTNWGEKGYVRIARDAGNMCGIASTASFPVVPKVTDDTDVLVPGINVRV